MNARYWYKYCVCVLTMCRRELQRPSHINIPSKKTKKTFHYTYQAYYTIPSYFVEDFQAATSMTWFILKLSRRKQPWLRLSQTTLYSRSHKSRSARDQSIPRSLRRRVSMKSSISQLTFLFCNIRVKATTKRCCKYIYASYCIITGTM